MIHWKLSALSVAVGAAATVGFVWLSRSRTRRRLIPSSSPNEHPPTLDDVARADALHDLEGSGEDLSELGLVESVEVEPVDMRSLDEEPLAGDEPVLGDEHYDAIDPEEMGTEWLRRATESTEPVLGRTRGCGGRASRWKHRLGGEYRASSARALGKARHRPLAERCRARAARSDGRESGGARQDE